MSEQEMHPQEKSYIDSSIPFYHPEDERHNTNYPFEKINPQTPQHKHSFNMRIALALSSVGFLILIFFPLASLTNAMILFHNVNAANMLIGSYSFFLLLIILTVIVNILYNRKR